MPSEPKLDAKLRPKGSDGTYRIEVTNTGDVTVTDVELEIPEDVPNWHPLIEALVEYPISELEPGQSVNVPTAVTMGGPVAFKLKLTGMYEDVRYSWERPISIHDV
jgi:hypothetical protein